MGEHRLVLWGKIGPGSHPCYHCAHPVSWAPGMKTSKGALVVDHLDHDTWNNDPGNLVPSCHQCNQKRKRVTRHVRDDETFVVAKSDCRRLRTVEQACQERGSAFMAVPSSHRKFCSPTCVGRNARRHQEPSTAWTVKDDEPFVVIAGQRLRAVSKACDGCQEQFLVANCYRNKRRYCSRECKSKWGRNGPRAGWKAAA